MYKCLRNKYKRNDVLEMFSEYSGLSKDFIKRAFEEFGIKALRPFAETAVDGIREELIQNKIKFKPIWYKEKIDASSQKVRRIRDSKYQTTDLRLYCRGSNERFFEKNRRISMRGTETQRAVIRDQSDQEMVTK